MATVSKKLETLLLRYIDTEDGPEKMREALRGSPVEVRYSSLMSVNWVYQSTAVHKGAALGDLESLRCMMFGFTSEQWYNIVKIKNFFNDTALHNAATGGHTNAIMFLLSKLSQEQRFEILKVQNLDLYNKSTPLHFAAKKKHDFALQAMLASVSPDQQLILLNIKDKLGKTTSDIYPIPELPYDVAAWTKLELRETILQVGADRQAELIEDLSQKCDKLAQERETANEKLEAMRTDIEKQRECKEQLSKELESADKNTKLMESEIAKLVQYNEQISGELSLAKDQITITMTNCLQQGNHKEKLSQELEEVSIRQKKLEEHSLQQKSTIDLLNIELVRQREEHAKKLERLKEEKLQQEQELKSLAERQKRLESVMERMEVLLGQPICIGPEMNQEYEADL